jgi:hypothetical protein
MIIPRLFVGAALTAWLMTFLGLVFTLLRAAMTAGARSTTMTAAPARQASETRRRIQ